MNDSKPWPQVERRVATLTKLANTLSPNTGKTDIALVIEETGQNRVALLCRQCTPINSETT